MFVEGPVRSEMYISHVHQPISLLGFNVTCPMLTIFNIISRLEINVLIVYTIRMLDYLIRRAHFRKEMNAIKIK